MNPFKEIRDLKERIEQLEYDKQHVLVKQSELNQLRDLVCGEHEWEDIGTGSTWQEVRCKRCRKVIAISCPHGGSVACKVCVKAFIDNQPSA